MVKLPSLTRWQQEILAVYEKIKKDKNPYWVDAEGVRLLVLPNVFSPHYFVDSIWFAKKLCEIVQQSSLLEIGSGTGIIALFCGLMGAKIVAIDINPAAVKNTKLNFRRHGVKASVRKGNLYQPLKKNEKFDFVFWNHPFNEWHEPVSDILLRAGFDSGYRDLERYIAQAKFHLTKKGRLLLGTANFANLKRVREIAKKNGYKLKTLQSIKCPVQAPQPSEEKNQVFNRLMVIELVR
jgi:release factor glutamine methyltransferase